MWYAGTVVFLQSFICQISSNCSTYFIMLWSFSSKSSLACESPTTYHTIYSIQGRGPVWIKEKYVLEYNELITMLTFIIFNYFNKPTLLLLIRTTYFTHIISYLCTLFYPKPVKFCTIDTTTHICVYCDSLFPVCCKQICYRLTDDGG
jgi:hypothetical protein